MRILEDRAERQHFVFARGLPDPFAAWSGAVQRLLKDGAWARPDGLLASLLLLDGACTEPDLAHAWEALASACRDDERVLIEWVGDDDRRQRRALSAPTVPGLAALPLRPRYEVAVKAFGRQWGDLREMVVTVQAAMACLLSGDLAAHVVGCAPLRALGRHGLVRLRSERVAYPVVAAAATASEDDEPDVTLVFGASELQLLDAMQAPGGGGGRGADFVDRIALACRLPRDAPPSHVMQRRILRSQLEVLMRGEDLRGWPAFLLYAALRLVRCGTRGHGRLAPSTIEAYVRLSFAGLHRGLAACPGEPSEIAPGIDWEREIYGPMLRDPAVEASQGGKLAAALTALHDLLVEVLGAPPLSQRLDPALPAPTGNANLVTPQEVARALRWLDEAAGDDRLLAQVRAMLALLASAACRSEDCWHIHLEGTSDLAETGVLRIDPAVDVGRGKTLAARRTIEIAAGPHREVLLAWIERRYDEGAMPRDLLLGDPQHEERRPFRPAAALALLNQLLKLASGDPTVGTHELRHAFISLARESLGAHEQLRLDTLSAQAGHEWVSTTLKYYSHLYEGPLRRQLDAALHGLRLTERQACLLTRDPPGALRKRWSRARARQPSRPDPRQALAWDMVEAAARRVPFPDIADDYVFEEPDNPLVRPPPRPLLFAEVFGVLHDLAGGHRPAQAALRWGLSTERVEAIALAVCAWWAEAGGAPKGHRPEAAVLPWSTDWPRAGQPKWVLLRQALERSDPRRLGPVVRSWRQVRYRQYLSMAEPEQADALLLWLAGASVPARRLVLCHLRSEEVGGPDAELVQEAVEHIGVAFGAPPALRPLRPRRGRPRCHLAISSGDGASPAACSMAGLHVLMFAAWVWIGVTEV